jgi:hypothetical protein
MVKGDTVVERRNFGTVLSAEILSQNPNHRLYQKEKNGKVQTSIRHTEARTRK